MQFSFFHQCFAIFVSLVGSYPLTRLPTKFEGDLLAISFNELYQYNGEYGDLKLNRFDGSPLNINFPSQMIGLFCDSLGLVLSVLSLDV